MRFPSLVVGLLVIGSLFAANARSDDGGKDLKALQGTWRLVAGEIGGQKMTAEELKKVKLVFKGDRYTVRRGNGPTVMGVVKLNPAKNSKTIEFTDADGSYKGKTLLGIYALKGDGVLRASRQSATSEVRHGNRNEPVLPCLEAREGLGQVTLSNYKIGTCEP